MSVWCCKFKGKFDCKGNRKMIFFILGPTHRSTPRINSSACLLNLPCTCFLPERGCSWCYQYRFWVDWKEKQRKNPISPAKLEDVKTNAQRSMVICLSQVVFMRDQPFYVSLVGWGLWCQFSWWKLVWLAELSGVLLKENWFDWLSLLLFY